MKKFLLFFLLCPFMGIAQTSDPLIFEIVTINISPEKSSQVESAMGAHNKKYHASGPHGARVYTVATGTNAGSYKWVMGPGPWSAFDTRPSDPAHDMDWDENVTKHQLPETNVEYIRFDPTLSRFPKDFNVNKLYVRYADVARGKMDKAKELIGKIHKVYAEKIPGETFGVYFNEVPSTSSGRDIVIVSFFDKFAWMGVDDGFDAKYEEMYGKNSVEELWDEWRDCTLSQESEIWEFKPELSGLPALVKAAERQ